MNFSFIFLFSSMSTLNALNSPTTMSFSAGGAGMTDVGLFPWWTFTFVPGNFFLDSTRTGVSFTSGDERIGRIGTITIMISSTCCNCRSSMAWINSRFDNCRSCDFESKAIWIPGSRWIGPHCNLEGWTLIWCGNDKSSALKKICILEGMLAL